MTTTHYKNRGNVSIVASILQVLKFITQILYWWIDIASFPDLTQFPESDKCSFTAIY